MSSFRDAMRRVITGDNAQGKSVVIIDGGPSSEIGNPDLVGCLKFGKTQPQEHLILVCTTILGPSVLC
jgi:hypothetical protein